jgi:hypothetical protein
MKKSVDNQSKRVVNTKYVKPRNETDYSLNVGTSNKPNPMDVDSDSGDRRFELNVPSPKYKKKSGQWWDNMWKKMSNPKAIAALYNYLNSIDLSNFDFKAKRKEALTPRYYAWIGQNQSNEPKILARFCHTLKQNGNFKSKFGAELLQLKSGFKQPIMKQMADGSYCIDQIVSMDKGALHKYYQSEMAGNGQHAKNKSNFDAAIVNLNLVSIQELKKSHGYPGWRFNVKSLLEELVANGNVEAQTLNNSVQDSGSLGKTTIL